MELVVRVKGKAAADDPEFKEIPVVTGRLALLEKQDVRKGCPGGHRPERKAQPPCDMKETEQNQDHPDGKGSGGDDGQQEIAVKASDRTGEIVRGMGVGKW